jgi:hypothetical protein
MAGHWIRPSIILRKGLVEERWTPGVKPQGDIKTPKKKSPAFRRDLPALTWFKPELATALALLIRFLALTVRILLLLPGLLTAALLLAGLLTRVLILLTRVLILLTWVLVRVVRVRHSRISLVERNQRQLQSAQLVSGELRFRWDHCVATACCDCGGRNPDLKLLLYKPFKLRPALLPHRVPTVRNRVPTVRK